MKFRLLLFACSLFVCSTALGQVVWLDAGVKVAYGGGVLLNSNVLDADNYSYDIASNLAYGAKLGLNYGNNGFTLDVMRGTYKSAFEFPDNTNETLEWKTWDIYAMYRRNGNLAYIEVGPKYSFLGDAQAQNIDLSDQYRNYLSAVLGFGWYVMGNDGRFSGILGFRLEYGFTDMASDAGKAAGAPIPAIQPPMANDSYAGSHPVVASLVFELNWGIGEFAATQCGARRKFVFF